MNSETFKKLLIGLKEALLQEQETGEAAEQTVELDQARVGRLSRMDAMQAQAMSVATGQRRRERLRQIDAALRRIADEQYGYCGQCGDEIAPERLKFDPAVLLCINCAAKQESS